MWCVQTRGGNFDIPAYIRFTTQEGKEGTIGKTKLYHQLYTTQQGTCGIQTKLIDTTDIFYPRDNKVNKALTT